MGWPCLKHVQPLNPKTSPPQETVAEQAKSRRAKNSFKDILKDLNINTEENLASDIPLWRHLNAKSDNTAEKNRSLQAERDHEVWKARVINTSYTYTHFCITCEKGFQVCIDLINQHISKFTNTSILHVDSCLGHLGLRRANTKKATTVLTVVV